MRAGRDARQSGIEYPSLTVTAEDLPYRTKGQHSRGWWVLLPMLDPADAACAGTDAECFHPVSNEADTHWSYPADRVAEARGMCKSCPLLASCQEWSIAHESHSIYGGLLPVERENIRRERGQIVVEPSALGSLGDAERVYLPELHERNTSASTPTYRMVEEDEDCFNSLDSLVHPFDEEDWVA